MPLSFDMSTDYSGTVEQLHAAFCDEQYWQARLAESGTDEWALDAFTLGHDGGVDVVTTQVLRAERLPGVVQQFHHGDLEIRRAETWTALCDGTAEASIAGSIVRAPVTVNGEAQLIGQTARARLDFRVVVEVHIPLVGRKMEKLIGTQLTALLKTEQEFTARWIAANHR